jgi:shikimate kinase
MEGNDRPEACVIFLNGFPGTGKLTIAQALRSKLKGVETRLLDNHLMIDAAEAVHPGRGLEHKTLRKRIRDAMFDELKALPMAKNLIIIMTGCLAANPEDAAVFAEHVAIAQHHDIPFYSFTISVDEKEHFWRLQSPDRIWGQKEAVSAR